MPRTADGSVSPVEFPSELRQRGRRFLFLAVASVGFAMALQMGLNANFLADEIGLSGFQLGLLESIRESCGIFALGILALGAGLAEPLLAMGMLAVFSIGVGAYAAVPSYTWVIVMSLVWSQGLHVWMPLPHSMMMSLAEPGRTGHRLGEMHAYGSAGFGAGLLAAFALTKAGLTIRPLYLLACGAGLIGAGACLGIPAEIKTEGPRFVFRREYRYFYLLSFLEGWRKQIFICFAGFLLVRKYGTPLETMLLLWITTKVIGYLAGPAVGKLIDRVGERKILVFYFSSLTVFFIGYATITVKAVLYSLFVIDSAFFVFAMALRTYVNKLVPANERTPTLSMGVAMNHAAAVTMPLAGGILWKFFGYQWAFAVGALAAMLSVGVAWRLPELIERNPEVS